MKKQLLKLALLGLLGSFGYTDNFDINRDGKVDKFSWNKTEYFVNGKKIPRNILMNKGFFINPKYRNKKILAKTLSNIQINQKKYLFFQQYEIDINEDFMEVSGSGNIQPLPKKEKGFTMSYGHYNSRVHNTVYISYKNNKLYLSNYIRNSSQLACKFTFLNQKPIKILDWHKLEIMSSEIKDKKIKIQCTVSSEEDNDYNKVLAKEIWGE